MNKKVESNNVQMLSKQLKEPGFLQDIWQQAQLVYRLMRDPEVPIYLKVLPFLALVYLFVPVDLIPDFLVPFGQLDDITALLVGAKIFVELAPPAVVAYHMEEIRQKSGRLSTNSDEVADAIVIDTEHEVVLKADKSE